MLSDTGAGRLPWFNGAAKDGAAEEIRARAAARIRIFFSVVEVYTVLFPVTLLNFKMGSV